MAQSPVYNPPIPYLGAIPGGLQPGQMVTFDGFVPPHSQRFAINLQCGPGVNPRDDMALHINVRFPEMCVVRNHLQAMNWGNEELAGGMPLSPGSNFQAIILCEQQCYKIAFNGVHFCEFPHRLPLYRVSHVTIDGDVNISTIQFQGSTPNFQGSAPGYQAPAWNNSMGGPAMGMPSAPPPYGPPPPYNPQQAFTQTSVPLNYSNMPPTGGYQPSSNVGFSLPPPTGGYQPIPSMGGYQSQPPIGGYQPPYPVGGSQVPSFNHGNATTTFLQPTQKNESSLGVKVLKYGLPLAGVGLGAYALGGGFSRSSSSSDDEWLG